MCTGSVGWDFTQSTAPQCWGPWLGRLEGDGR